MPVNHDNDSSDEEDHAPPKRYPLGSGPSDGFIYVPPTKEENALLEARNQAANEGAWMADYFPSSQRGHPPDGGYGATAATQQLRQAQPPPNGQGGIDQWTSQLDEGVPQGEWDRDRHRSPPGSVRRKLLHRSGSSSDEEEESLADTKSYDSGEVEGEYENGIPTRASIAKAQQDLSDRMKRARELTVEEKRRVDEIKARTGKKG